MQQPLRLEVSSLRSSQFQSSESAESLGLLIEEHEIISENTQSHLTDLSQTQSSTSQSSTSNWQWKVFSSTFITIFLAELGDKTQVSTLLMSAEFHAPWVIFAGAATALVTTSLLGVLIGRWLSTCFSPKTLDTAAGITLALISVWLFWDVAQM